MEDMLMSTKEAERYRLLKKHQDKELSLTQVADILQISYRQSKRLWKQFQELGVKGLLSKKRGKTNNHLDPNLERQILLKLLRMAGAPGRLKIGSNRIYITDKEKL